MAGIKKAISLKGLDIPASTTAYQENLRVNTQPTEQKWYKGSEPTVREAMAQMMLVYNQNQQLGEQLQRDYSVMQADRSSFAYNPHVKPTNQAVEDLAAAGIDVSNIDDAWFDNNAYLKSYYRTTGTTNNPSKPTKGTQDEINGYNYYQVLKSKDDTNNADKEIAALKEELTFLANWKDRNYSDEEIKDMIDWSKYPTLKKMREGVANGTPIELNRAVDYPSDDWMYGVMWAARNDGGSGSVWQDMAHSSLGDGNVWEDNPELYAKRDLSACITE